MFKYLNEEELEKMTADQRKYYYEQKRDHEAKELQKTVNEAVIAALPSRSKELAALHPTKTEVEIKAMVTAEETAKATKEAKIDELFETVAQIKENTGGASAPIVKMFDEVKTNKEALRKMIRSEGPEVELKTTVARSAIANNPYQILDPQIGQLLRVKRSLYDKCTKFPVAIGNHNGTINYIDWDESTTVKAAAMVAEGAAFPESTATFKTTSIKLRKVGDSLPVNEEFFEDEATAAAELDMFVNVNVNTKIDDQIVNGDNTGENLKGLLASVPEFAVVASGITDANIYDLYTKVKSTITSVGGSKYAPDMCAANAATIDRLLLKKDANFNYQFPPNHPIFNIMVEDNHLADNVMVVGDSRFMRLYEMGGVAMSRGMINDQYTKDQLTIKARARLAFLIKNSDSSGFRKISDITAALATLAS